MGSRNFRYPDLQHDETRGRPRTAKCGTYNRIYCNWELGDYDGHFEMQTVHRTTQVRNYKKTFLGPALRKSNRGLWSLLLMQATVPDSQTR